MIKRLADIVVSLFILVALSPLFIILSLLLLVTTGWPIFYSQKRVGQHFKEFDIIKFRTMRSDAEIDGPQLASIDDDRITPIGKLMRKWRLDELPQFINVLTGSMSIVGPRPERLYYVNQLQDLNPNYKTLFSVKPGITSNGMVQYGYASTVEEMQQRIPYDLEYMKQLSLANDLKVLLQTVKVVLEGSGK